MNTPPSLHYAYLDGVVWIRIDGKGSFDVSPHLKTFTTCELDAGRTQFVLDLEKCQGMDSTFMGTLLALSREVSAKASGVFEVVNANTRNIQLLRNLGLDLILSLDERGERWGKQRRLVEQQLTECSGTASDKAATAEVMLTAHEALAEAQPENEARFRDVIRYLKKEVSCASK